MSNLLTAVHSSGKTDEHNYNAQGSPIDIAYNPFGRAAGNDDADGDGKKLPLTCAYQLDDSGRSLSLAVTPVKWQS